MTKSKTSTLHLLLKLPKNGDERFETSDLVEAHNNVCEEYGTVWFGKSGRPLSRTLNDKLKELIREGMHPKLILLYGPTGQRKFFSGRIAALATSGKPNPAQVPAYYRDMTAFISQWFEIGPLKLMTKREVDGLVVASSGRAVSEVAPRSQAPYMTVKKKD